jgi:hypothetical protein
MMKDYCLPMVLLEFADSNRYAVNYSEAIAHRMQSDNAMHQFLQPESFSPNPSVL